MANSYQEALNEIVDTYLPKFVDAENGGTIITGAIAEGLEKELTTLSERYDMEYDRVYEDFNLIGHYVFVKGTS